MKKNRHAKIKIFKKFFITLINQILIIFKIMKIILGINANHADSSACIIINGKIIAAIEEERLNRIKHFSGYPIKAIKNV